MKMSTQLEPSMLAEVRMLGTAHPWELLLRSQPGHVGSAQARKLQVSHLWCSVVRAVKSQGLLGNPECPPGEPPTKRSPNLSDPHYSWRGGLCLLEGSLRSHLPCHHQRRKVARKPWGVIKTTLVLPTITMTVIVKNTVICWDWWAPGIQELIGYNPSEWVMRLILWTYKQIILISCSRYCDSCNCRCHGSSEEKNTTR